MTLDEKAIEFSSRLCNQSGNYSKGEIETAYVIGATDNEELRKGETGSFGQALISLQRGWRVARKGWNGKGMYLWLLPAAMIKAEWCKEPHLKEVAEANGGEIEGLASIRMMTADKKILTGWLASQTDMLANDWTIVE